MALAKPAGTWSYADLATLPEDGTRYEIIDGELYEMPAPTWAHSQVIAGLISVLLPVPQRLGARWATAPLDVFFPGADPVQPDLLVLLPDSRARVVRRGVEGPPDLLVEVLSPSNRAHDQVRKRALYARGGVREYWLVDPEQRVIEVINERGVTVHRVDARSEPVLRSPLLGEPSHWMCYSRPRVTNRASCR